MPIAPVRIPSIRKIVPNFTTPVSASTPTATSSRWNLIAKLTISLGAFLMPLAVGTWTLDRWEIHKSIILLLVVTIAWFCFFIDQFKRPVAAWKWHPLDWLVLVLGLSAVIGTLVSLDWWTSLTGLQGSYGETLPVTLGFMSIYILSARLFRTTADRMMVWAALLGGIGLSLLLQLFQLSKASLFSGILANDQLFSTLTSSPLQVAILAATVATIGLLLWPKAKERWAQLSLIAVVTLGWLILFFIGQAVAWAVFALGMIVVVINQTYRPMATPRLVFLAVGLAAVGILGQFVHLNKSANVPPSTELSLNQSTSAATAFSTLAHRPVLGAGPNTWLNAFVQYRPLSFNQDPQWGSRYLRSGAEWSQLLATTGVVGLTAWIGIFVIAGWEFWRRLRGGYSFTLLAGLFVVGMLALTAILTNWSFSLLALGWFALGLGRSKLGESDQQIFVQRTAMPAVGFAMVVILAILVWYPAINIYTSQVVYATAQQKISANGNTTDIISLLEQSLHHDGHNLDAAILLANYYGRQVLEQAQANKIPEAQQSLTLATTTIRKAVKTNASNPVAFEAENNILNGLSSYLPNPEEQANANFIALQKLEPSNPIHDVGYGQTLLVIRARALANTAGSTSPDKLKGYLQQALRAYNEALRKKPDYPQARFARADAYMTAGDFQLALDDLDALTTSTPLYGPFWTAKGIALAKLDKIDLATPVFEQAITLDPTNVNAYLTYSQIMTEAKKLTEAKEVLNRGLKAIPDNADLDAALKKLPTKI